jgi:hypothetical protein
MDLAATFADPPRSITRFATRSREITYVKPPTSSLDWAGADWTSPTSLDFEQQTMTAKTYGAQTAYGHERPVHPLDLVRDLAAMWQGMRRTITQERHVVDADEHLGVTIDGDLMRDWGTIQVRVKCWPAIEGVTTPKRDVTW